MLMRVKKTHLVPLKVFFHLCKKNPRLLGLPDLDLVRDFISHFGGTTPDAWPDQTSDTNIPDELIESETEESYLELEISDDSIGPEVDDPPQAIGNYTPKPKEAKRSNKKKIPETKPKQPEVVNSDHRKKKQKMSICVSIDITMPEEDWLKLVKEAEAQDNKPSQQHSVIWQGTLEWPDVTVKSSKKKRPTSLLPCQILTILKDGEPELKTESWPRNLILQLVPKEMITKLDQTFIRNSRCIKFRPIPSKNLERFTRAINILKNMTAGLVHFFPPSIMSTSPTTKFEVMIILLHSVKREYIGFIPNDQEGFSSNALKASEDSTKDFEIPNKTQIGPVNNNIPGSTTSTTSKCERCDNVSESNKTINNQEQSLDNPGDQTQKPKQPGADEDIMD